MIRLSKRNKKKASVLDYQEFMDVASQLRNGCERNGKMGSIVCGMMLQMLDIVKGQDPRNFSDNLDNNLNSAFPHLLEKYRSCFKPVKDNMFKSNTVSANEDRSVNRSNNSDIDLVNNISLTNVSDTVVNNKCDDHLQRNETSIVIPKRPIGQSNASCLRKRPMVEKIEEKCFKKRQIGKYIKVDNLVLPNKKAESKKLRKPVHCSFCQEQGHKKTNCPMKHGYGDEKIGLESKISTSPFSQETRKRQNKVNGNLNFMFYSIAKGNYYASKISSYLILFGNWVCQKISSCDG